MKKDFNLNDYVWVKLTDRGRQIHREFHKEFSDRLPVRFEYRAPKEDAEGWSEWQAWHLIQIFGKHIGLGIPTPFETTIRIVLPDSAP